MKKILLICLSVGFAFTGIGQSVTSSTPGTKQMTVAESNRLNGNSEPTINGKPYSQYKAEQQALKNATSAKVVTPGELKIVTPQEMKTQPTVEPAVKTYTAKKEASVQTSESAQLVAMPVVTLKVDEQTSAAAQVLEVPVKNPGTQAVQSNKVAEQPLNPAESKVKVPATPVVPMQTQKAKEQQ